MFNGKNKIQKQETIEITAHDKKLTFSVFHNTIEALEEYVEKIGYPGFKKQIFDKSINSLDRSPEDLAEDFLIQLYCLKAMVNKKPSFLRDEVKEKFYKWIDATGINASNCSDKLKNYLFEINEILEGGGERFVKQMENKLDNSKSTPADALKVFSAFQNPINKNREQEELLKGKTHKDVKIESKFDDANDEKGKGVFGKIHQEIAHKKDSFSFYSGGEILNSPHPTNLVEVVQDVKNKPQNWVLDEVITRLSNFGETEQKLALYCQHARLDEYIEGKLNFNNNPIYLWENFNVLQRFEIKKVKNISGDYLIKEEIRWVIREVKENSRVWRIEAIKGQVYLIHNSARIKDNEVGTLIHNQQKFSEAEWAEINGAFERAKLIDDIKQNASLERGLFVIDQKTGEVSENEDWFIHNSLERKIDDKTGYLIYVPSLMIRAKDLGEAEQKEVNYNQQVQTETNRRGGGILGNPYIWGSFTIISLIGLAFVR